MLCIAGTSDFKVLNHTIKDESFVHQLWQLIVEESADKQFHVSRLLIPFRSVFPGVFSSWKTSQSITNILLKVVKSRSLSLTVLNNGLFLRSRLRTLLESHWSWIDAGHKKIYLVFKSNPCCLQRLFLPFPCVSLFTVLSKMKKVSKPFYSRVGLL